VLRWSARARADLKAIHDYIAKDSPLNAKAVAREILARAATLPETPRVGRIVPELSDADIREVPVHAWRCHLPVARRRPLRPHPRPQATRARPRRPARLNRQRCFDANGSRSSILHSPLKRHLLGHNGPQE
jgi:plasmid stabilization system protein ParE